MLRSIDLSSNDLGDCGLKTLFEHLMENSVCQRLHESFMEGWVRRDFFSLADTKNHQSTKQSHRWWGRSSDWNIDVHLSGESCSNARSIWLMIANRNWSPSILLRIRLVTLGLNIWRWCWERMKFAFLLVRPTLMILCSFNRRYSIISTCLETKLVSLESSA